MDCKKIRYDLAEIRKAASNGNRALWSGDNTNLSLQLDLIEVVVQRIRAEMRGVGWHTYSQPTNP